MDRGNTALILPLGILVGLILGAYGGFYFANTRPLATNANPSPSVPSAVVSTPGKILIANHTSSVNPDADKYMSFKFNYPDKYVVTNDDLLSYFKSQGGSAPPVMMLTTNGQPLALDDEQNQRYLDTPGEVLKSGKDCILIWQTMGFKSFQEWEEFGGKSFEMETESSIHRGIYSVKKRLAKDKESGEKQVQAIMNMPKDVGYFFQTCNTNSEKDLDLILRTFEIRGDL